MIAPNPAGAIRRPFAQTWLEDTDVNVQVDGREMENSAVSYFRLFSVKLVSVHLFMAILTNISFSI